MRLREIASVVRSKNAGPYILTFDIIFPSDQVWDRVVDAGFLTRSSVSKAYNISPNEVLSFDLYPTIRAVKFSIRRSVPSGSFGDSDVYGAQQHGPLLDLVVL